MFWLRPAGSRSCMETFEKGGWDAIGGRVLLRCDRSMPRWLKPELWGFLACLDYGDEEMPLTEIERPFFGANMVFRREVFEKVGGFDVGLGRKGKVLVGGEEIDLFGRMLASGLRVVYQPRAAVDHVVDPRRLRKGTSADSTTRRGASGECGGTISMVGRFWGSLVPLPPVGP